MQITGVQAAAGQQGGAPGNASGAAGIFSLFFEAAVAAGAGAQEGLAGEDAGLALLDSIEATAEALPPGSKEEEAQADDPGGEDAVLSLLATSLAPTPPPAFDVPSASPEVSEAEGIGASGPALVSAPATVPPFVLPQTLVPAAADELAAVQEPSVKGAAPLVPATDPGEAPAFVASTAEAARAAAPAHVNSKPWSGTEPPREKDAEPTGDGKAPVRDRAGTERLWGFWLRRGRGPAESPRFEMPRGQGAATGEKLPPPKSEAETEPVITLRPLPWGQDPERLPGPPVAPRVESDLPEAETPPEKPGAEHVAAAAGPAATKEAPTAAQDASAATKPSPYASRAPAPAEQVVRGIKLSLSPQGDKVTVQLEPGSLGKVELVLARNDDGVSAHFRVETPQAHQALLSEAPTLRQALESRGIPLVEVFVDMEDRRQQGAENGRSTGKNGSRRQAQPDEIRGAEHGTAPPGLAMAWGIDTRV